MLNGQTLVLAKALARKYTDESHIYGVHWNRGDDPTMTRTGHAMGMVAEAGVDGLNVRNDFDSASIYREIGEVTDSLGNVFIRIPKFYIRKRNGDGFKSWEISKTKYPGFYLPKCFWDFTKNRELPYVLIGKHRASLGADNKLESKPDVFPLVSRSIVSFREYAQANNVNGLAGYQQMDIHTQDILTTLFYVEFATLNSQSIMSGFSSGSYSDSYVALHTESGTNRVVLPNSQADAFRVWQSIGIGTSRGSNNIAESRLVTSIDVADTDNKAIVFDGAPVDVAAGNYVYNTAFKTGFSRNIAASSGSPVSNSDGKWPCSYRGIESPWGDIYTFIDGVNITDYQAWVAANADDYASNLFAHPYEQVGYVNGPTNGYIKDMGWDAAHPYVEFPVEIGAGSATYYSDYYYQASGQRIAVVGGNWSNGAYAGLSFWNLYFSSGDATVYIGGRLLKKAL